jgi:hypothetical protein
MVVPSLETPMPFSLVIAVLAVSFVFQPGAAPPPAPNTLTAAEAAAGWELLFDGKTLDGWRGYRREQLPDAGWEVKDGTLRTVARAKSTDLVTRKTFRDFELTWEWRVAPGGNSGVKYFVTEERPKSPGHEYQMIDDPGYPGKLTPQQLTAAFYDVLPTAPDKPLRPAGEWNTSRIVVRGNLVEHWLNGKNVLTYELGSAAVKAGLANSKFKGEPGFGEKIDGHIMLTYHQDECWYRNLKIRETR